VAPHLILPQEKDRQDQEADVLNSGGELNPLSVSQSSQGRIGGRMGQRIEDDEQIGFENPVQFRGGQVGDGQNRDDGGAIPNIDASKVQREPEREPSKDPNSYVEEEKSHGVPRGSSGIQREGGANSTDPFAENQYNVE